MGLISDIFCDFILPSHLCGHLLEIAIGMIIILERDSSQIEKDETQFDV